MTTKIEEAEKLTGDIWDSMTPIEREQLGMKAKLDAEERGQRWIGLWPEKKRALIREFKKEQLAKPPIVGGKPKAEKGKVISKAIPVGEFVKVTLKEEGKRQWSFWARKDVETPLGNIYVPVSKEGDSFTRIKKGATIITKDLISRGLIVKEEPAHIDRTYGTMRVGKLPPPPISKRSPRLSGGRVSRITPRRPRLKR